MSSRSIVLVVLPLVLLAACSGGAPTTTNPLPQGPVVTAYAGPAPATADVQAFRLNLWENIKANDRCGNCHHAAGQQPRFARNDDVNLAYADANPVVDLAQPELSRLVSKVAGGHNCWLASNQACADILSTWIRNWAGNLPGAGGTRISLVAPIDQEVGASRSFPDSAALFAATVHPLLASPARGNCARCHSAAAATPQAPFIASADIEEAYAAARSRINLDDPAASRLVVRLRDEFHNCWSGSCAADATAMLAAVQGFVAGIPVTPVDPQWVTSKALRMVDGIVASGGNRIDAHVVARYEFKTGSGATAYDTSGVEPALDLNLSGNTAWVGGWGVEFKAGSRAQGSTTASRKLATRIKATGEYSIELWAVPANVVQEDAWLLSYSGSNSSRNVTLAQRAYQYEALGRAAGTGANGTPALQTRDADRDAQASLQHLVLTYDPLRGRRLYVNGNDTGDVDPRSGGALADWDDSFALVLGNETSGQRQWQGVLRFAAVHDRALDAAQVQQNFAAGVGERYLLLFNVSHLLGVPKAYVMLEASQYDSHAYLFTRPAFVGLDDAALPDGVPLQGLRIGINGSLPEAGQGFATLQATLRRADHVSGSGQLLSDRGTVLALQKGAVADQFFLAFERLGSRSNVVVEGPVMVAPPVDRPASPRIGVRSFDPVNHSLAQVTGIPVTHPAVAATFERVRQQLPPTADLEAFLAAHQTGIAQLAIQYCAALVDDPTARAAFFGTGFNPAMPAATQFGTPTGRSQVFDPLLARAAGTGLPDQPTAATLRAELDALAQRLLARGTDTTTLTKASCAAVLGSGVLSLH
jgi:mono/diheme cytochrome c family protein